MASIFQDTFIDYLLRLSLGIRIAPHAEELDSSLWPDMIHQEKTTDTEHPPHQEDRKRTSAVPSVEEVQQDDQNTHTLSPRSSATRVLDTEGVGASDTEKGEATILLVDWYGPDDPAKPLNWSRNKKFWVLFQTCLWTFTMYIGSSIYTAGIPGVAEDFGVSAVAATVGLTAFVAGYGIGPMFLSPMSEIPQIGRMPIYIVTCVLFTVLQVPTALATNYGMLIAFRFITGFVGSPILATGGATIADMFIPQKRSYGIALWGLFGVAAPSLGPLVGGFAAHAKTWRWTLWELMWVSGFTATVLFLFFPETSHSNILYRRAARLRRLTRNPHIMSQSEIDARHMTAGDVAMMMLVRPFTLNFQEPIVLMLNLYLALIYALLYCWFESFPIVFGGIYGFAPQHVGLAFLGVLVGSIVVIPPFFSYLYYHQEPQYNERNELKPEKRMPTAIVGAFFVPVCLFWFGWSARPSIHWIMPIIGSSFFSIAGILLFNSVLNYLADAYPLYAASVLAGNDLMRSLFGAAFPLFAGAMYRNLGTGWASTLLGLLSCAFIPIPILLYVYGERIRMVSKRARHDI
ncbi:putative caffeine resistance protein 5 [Artomyces pyxidatus]|uniref:Caffeine resistance protein 5 n=1 Tax=Artomyces pyxidatus TaxID=48021 RepID=A0ACB8T339_9AGAM|nr:putative caffeine resistance protein 5 [Artomyces pyxidatus]